MVNNLKKNDASIAIVKVDGDSSPGLKADYEVRGFPALHFYKVNVLGPVVFNGNENVRESLVHSS